MRCYPTIRYGLTIEGCFSKYTSMYSPPWWCDYDTGIWTDPSDSLVRPIFWLDLSCINFVNLSKKKQTILIPRPSRFSGKTQEILKKYYLNDHWWLWWSDHSHPPTKPQWFEYFAWILNCDRFLIVLSSLNIN